MRVGGNHSGDKWTKGGSGSRKNGIYIDFSHFAELAEQLDNLGASLLSKPSKHIHFTHLFLCFL